MALAAVAGLLIIAACDTADTTNPVVSIVFPAGGATVNKGDIVIKAVATDNKAVTKVEFYVDDTLVGTDNTGDADTLFQYTWSDTAGQVAGHSYELIAKAFDAAENTKSSSAVTITIGGGGAGPTVAIVSPANGSTIGVGPTTIKAKAVDARGMAKVVFYDGATTVGEDTSAVADTFSVSWTATAGSHTLKAFATNDSGGTAWDSIVVTVTGGSGPTHHSGVIPANETWYPSGNPHILDDDVYTGDGVTLTIMPGCYVQASADVELYCGAANPGSIVAVGKADSMITFTALTDTVAGFWNGISFYGNTISTAKMSYCNVLFGGKTSDNLGAVRVDATNIKFDHNLVRKSGSNGVWVSYSGYFSDFTNNTVTGCTKYAVHIGAANVPTLGAGNTLTGNTKNGIEVFNSAVTSSGTWLNHGVPYVVTDDVAIDQDATLTIEAGCTIALEADVEFYCGYSSPGSIIAVGTAASPITFTAASDTVAGAWTGVSFYGNTISTAKMSYCNVLFGGTTSDNLGAVRVDATNIKFDHNLVRKSGSNGVWGSYGGYFSDFTNNTITGCTKYAVHIGAANVPTLGAGNTLTGNTKNGIEVFHSAVTTSGTWLNHGVPYVVTDDVTIDQNAVVTISAGCTVALDPQIEFYAGYSSPGGIIADGTAGQITFTSSVPSPAPGDWARLSFYGNSMNSQCKLINCKFSYGGSDSYGDIYIDNCTPTVTGCDFGYSSAYGIYLSGSEFPDPATLRANNTFHDNASGDIREP
jgi:hypothetical protein